MPSAAPILLKIQEVLAAKQTYAAVKLGKQLMLLERDMLIENDRSSVA